jgi:hypothetical protein
MRGVRWRTPGDVIRVIPGVRHCFLEEIRGRQRRRDSRSEDRNRCAMAYCPNGAPPPEVHFSGGEAHARTLSDRLDAIRPGFICGSFPSVRPSWPVRDGSRIIEDHSSVVKVKDSVTLRAAGLSCLIGIAKNG